jgi:hypothetical protein
MNNENGNGQRPALAFKQQQPQVAIIGQPFTIKGWFPTVLLVCNCGANEALMVPRGAGAQCPACKRVFTIQAVQGNVQFGIGMMTGEDFAASILKDSIHG